MKGNHTRKHGSYKKTLSPEVALNFYAGEQHRLEPGENGWS